jgi:ribosomal protein S18 acetylase RimI-like enzyme
MEGLTIRAASSEDQRRIASLIGDDPGREAVGIFFGDRRLARRMGVALAMLPESADGWRCSTLAEMDGVVVGMIQAGDDLPKFRPTARVVWTSLTIMGPIRLIRIIPRMAAQGRAQPTRPKGSYYIAELNVDPTYRNRGIGSALLDWAAEDAESRGFDVMSLTTTTINPARRLYERHGFSVTETVTDDAYERHTGIEGRVLMLKKLR